MNVVTFIYLSASAHVHDVVSRNNVDSKLFQLVLFNAFGILPSLSRDIESPVASPFPLTNANSFYCRNTPTDCKHMDKRGPV